jgi:protein involved in polysaccharide export with SLBB domain
MKNLGKCAGRAVSLAAVLLGLAACGHRASSGPSGPPVAALLPPAPAEPTSDYRLRLADEVDVKFLYQPDLNVHVVVRPDGRISVPAVGELTAVGMTPGELEREIVERSSTHLRNPEVAAVVSKIGEQRVYIGGEVLHPGFVTLRADMTLLQAVLEAGGFRRTARLDSILLLTPGPDGKFSAARVNMDQVVNNGVPERVRLRPDAVVYAPQTWIGEMNDVVDLYVRGLIPAMPRVGVGYSLSQ